LISACELFLPYAHTMSRLCRSCLSCWIRACPASARTRCLKPTGCMRVEKEESLPILLCISCILFLSFFRLFFLSFVFLSFYIFIFIDVINRSLTRCAVGLCRARMIWRLRPMCAPSSATPLSISAQRATTSSSTSRTTFRIDVNLNLVVVIV
jgi:hypothetical protein